MTARSGLMAVLTVLLIAAGMPLLLRAGVDSAVPRAASPANAGQHDFDFEVGSWRAHLKRRLHPLQVSNEWIEYEGTSVVRKVWDGRANLGELNVANATMRIQGLTLRLYNPESHQWSIYWANSRDGALTAPMVGGWSNGRGVFYDQESFEGRAIFARFIFSDVTATGFCPRETLERRRCKLRHSFDCTRRPQDVFALHCRIGRASFVMG